MMMIIRKTKQTKWKYIKCNDDDKQMQTCISEKKELKKSKKSFRPVSGIEFACHVIHRSDFIIIIIIIKKN